MEELAAHGIEVGVITNGMFARDEVLDGLQRCKWVKFSLHTHIAENHPRIMGASSAAFQLACDNVRRSIQKRFSGEPRIGVGCVITKWSDTDEHILGFYDWFVEVGVDYVLYKDCLDPSGAFTSRRGRDDFAALIPQFKARAAATGVYTNFHTFVRDFMSKRAVFTGRCPVVWDGLVCVIGATGDVFGCVPIMQRRSMGDTYGNCTTNSLREIWEGQRRRSWLESQNDANCPACRYERMFETMNRLLDGAISGAAESKDAHWKFL